MSERRANTSDVRPCPAQKCLHGRPPPTEAGSLLDLLWVMPTMVRMKHLVALCCVAAVAGFEIADACTGIGITAKDGGVVVGRTLEFGAPPESDLIVFPAGSEFQGSTPTGDGLKFTAKYGFCGANGFGIEDLILDGMNEKGLVVGLFYFPGYAEYARPTQENAARGMGPQTLGAWLLGNFATVGEVIAGIDGIAVLPVEVPALQEVPGAHLKVEDASGRCIVIEPRGGKLVVSENPVRVLTNAPGFGWHLTNLTNFLNQTSEYPKNRDLNGLKLSPFGMGAGMVGIPGDFTPPSRFVRMVFFSQCLDQQPDSPSAVAAVFHLLNNFDIPFGVARPPAGTAEGDPDFTPWAAVADTKEGKYYWRTFGDQNIRHIDLAKALAKTGKAPSKMFLGSQKPVYRLQSSDATDLLK
jgi:choloylglycine hydrolase